MQIESHKNRQNKKAKRLNSIRGTQRFTEPSQTNGGVNIRINSETAIPKLKNLAQEYIGVSDPYGFLTNLREALGIPNSQGASKYGVVTIPKEDGSVLEASLRITNHNSDAETYITHNANYEYNLSILVRKNFKPKTFKPHNDVVLDEFVYYGKRMQRVENPLTQIINSIIGFLQSGVYNDTTGVAFKNTSPQTNDNNQLNCNTNMNKKLIRLTESDLHRIVKESVNKILSEAIINELDPRTYASLADKRAAQGQDDKATIAKQAARNAWNKQYGYDYNNGIDGYGYRKMGGFQFTHNAGSNYGISSMHGNMNSTQSYAYNPQKGTEWHGNGRGDSYTQQHMYDSGDNGAHRVADEMENGNGVYQNGRWQ